VVATVSWVGIFLSRGSIYPSTPGTGRGSRTSELLCYNEDGTLLAEGHIFRLLDIEGVEEFEGRGCGVMI
jgi:hypothetical protein